MCLECAAHTQGPYVSGVCYTHTQGRMCLECATHTGSVCVWSVLHTHTGSVCVWSVLHTHTGPYVSGVCYTHRVCMCLECATHTQGLYVSGVCCTQTGSVCVWSVLHTHSICTVQNTDLLLFLPVIVVHNGGDAGLKEVYGADRVLPDQLLISEHGQYTVHVQEGGHQYLAVRHRSKPHSHQ